MSCFGRKKVIRELRDQPPLDYVVKIKNFSQIWINPNANKNYYESSDFEVGGYKWRLRMRKTYSYPKYRFSLYLVLSESNSLPLEKEVNAYFKLVIYNQIQDKYLTFEDGKRKARRFRGTKTEWGVDHLFSSDFFKNSRSGYVVNNSCIFGADVFVLNPNNGVVKGESTSIMTAGDLGYNNIFTWNIQNFGKLNEEKYISEVFTIGGHKWSLELYPNGDPKYASSEAPIKSAGNLSAYLCLEDSEAFDPEEKLKVDYYLRVRDQIRSNHHQKLVRNFHFSASAKRCGFPKFMPLYLLDDSSKRYLLNGAMTLQVEITLLSIVNKFA